MISGGTLPAPFMSLTGLFLNFFVEPGRSRTSFPATLVPVAFGHHLRRPALLDRRSPGEVVHGGKGLIVARSEARNPEGKPVVTAVASFMRRKIRDWVPVVSSR